jgi:hypothetical protein
MLIVYFVEEEKLHFCYGGATYFDEISNGSQNAGS